MTSPPGAIDTHGHCVPLSFLTEFADFRSPGVTVERSDDAYVVTFPGRPALRPIRGVMVDSGARRDWMDAQRVVHQIVAPWLDVQGQELPPAEGAFWVARLNDHLAETVAASQGALSAHATLHLRDPESAAAELRRAVTELGMRSVMLPCTLSDGRLSDPEMDWVWDAAVELGTPVLLHATTASPASELLSQYPVLKGLFGRHIETSLVTAELIISGVLDRHPELKFVNVHGGGVLPFQMGRFDQDAGATMSRLPSEVLRTMYYDTVLLTPQALRYLVEVMGADRVVVGSDFGATPAERPGVDVTGPVLELGVELAPLVLVDNAKTLFRLIL